MPLIGYWPMDGNAQDKSGYGGHGTLNGSPSTIPALRPGGEGSALKFQTSSAQYINYGSVANIGTKDFAVSAWCRIINGAIVNGVAVKRSFVSTSEVGWRVGFSTTNRPFFTLCDGLSTRVETTWGAALSTGVVYHVVWNFDRDTACFAFVNGAQHGSGTNVLTTHQGSVTNTQPLVTGGNRSDLPITQYADIEVDDLRIFDHYLSTGEIATLYEHGLRRLLGAVSIKMLRARTRANLLRAKVTAPMLRSKGKVVLVG